MDFTIYLICLGVGLVFTLATAIMGHAFGHGHDAHMGGSGGHAEAGVDASDMPGVSAFSPTVIASFITAFGGFGIIFHQIPLTRSAWASAPLAVLGGSLTASVVLWLLRQLFLQTQSSSESKVAKLIGVTATVITPIPDGAVGEIAYVRGGTRYTAPARCETNAALGNGKLVKITRIVGSQIYVQPL